MIQVKQLHDSGLSDGKIAKQLGRRVNEIHYYRYYVLKLPAHQIKRVYSDHESKLKGYIIRSIKSSAKRRGIYFDLKPEDLVLNVNCPLLGFKLDYKNFQGGSVFNSKNYATVDRIDSSKGYVKGNVWIISRLANNMKSCATFEELKLFSINIQNMI